MQTQRPETGRTALDSDLRAAEDRAATAALSFLVERVPGMEAIEASNNLQLLLRRQIERLWHVGNAMAFPFQPAIRCAATPGLGRIGSFAPRAAFESAKNQDQSSGSLSKSEGNLAGKALKFE